MSLRTLMNQTFQVSRLQKVPDGAGGHSKEWVYSHDVKGRLRPTIRVAEQMRAEQSGAEITHVFYCLVGVDVKRNDQLTDGKRTIQIVAVREPSKPSHYECDAKEIQQEGG